MTEAQRQHDAYQDLLRNPDGTYKTFDELRRHESKFRALWSIVAQMQNGTCPRCAHIDDAHKFVHSRTVLSFIYAWQCPQCGFHITREQVDSVASETRKFNAAMVITWEEHFRVGHTNNQHADSADASAKAQ